MRLMAHVAALSLTLLMTAGMLSSTLTAADSRTPESSITPNNRNPKRHDSFMARIKQGPVGLLFLGDSITDGWPGRSKETWAKFDAYHQADFGVSGERTEDVLWRITNGELDGIDPKAVVIMIGTNNIGHFNEEKPEWVAAGVKKILEVVHEKLPKAKILLLGVFPRGATKDDGKRQKVDAINALIKEFNDGKVVTYLDIGPKFLDAQGNLPKEIMPDALHPNAQGYQIWYDAMWPVLEPMLK
ncbi:MAG TPA: GDSL-type esterase/lipase family protein [Planctomycetota bacterium]|nr:GDSL-type esterase/lipase family protein [Planctomycetota bacterium]